MRTRSVLPALLVMLPTVAFAAEDLAANASRCMALGRQLSGTAEVIGDTQAARDYTSRLSQQAQEIRKVRREMNRMRCGNGSIVHLGGAPADACADFAQTLDSMEQNRLAIIQQRQSSITMVHSLGPRNEDDIREEMRSLRCGEIDYATIPASIGPNSGAAPDKAPDKAPADQGNSIIKFNKSPQIAAHQDPSPTVPERDWNAERPIRMVGPQFFPDDNRIDLTKPAIPGAQPQQ